MSEPSGKPHATRPHTAHLVAAWLCAAGAAATATFFVLALASGSLTGRDDTTVGGAALVAVVLFLTVTAAVAALLAYAGHAVWSRGRRLPAGLLGGVALVIGTAALLVEFAESGGREEGALVGWGAMATWALALLVAVSIPARAQVQPGELANRR
ncbi:hypothetical protein [Catellatospora tritici]|uniref:hypothetical protein n=1 Tax=Catellatospora tritici TaxID=2851566 RepID=UPI001C2DCF35|nr:hypothetical protein [Catellatospora tritici]MBV1850750.1 hypothetical protein [Catellatospora tritici]MBV1851003.1 hypothetical protein [Catellatospora tritici]